MTAKAAGKWASPDRGKVTVAAYGADWLSLHPKLSPRTRELYASVMRNHINPHLGDVPMGALTTAAVRRWHAKLHDTASPSVAAKSYGVLRAICNTAVEDNVIGATPCTVKGAGVAHHPERPIATVAEVQALADAVPARYRALVLTAAWTGLRLGELAALTRADVDLLHGAVTVSKNLQRLDDGTKVIGVPKSKAGYRTVTLPPPLVPTISEHLERYVGPARDALVFTMSRGGAIDRSRWADRWRKAREAIGRPDLRFHDLRHTGNTLAAATGASTRELMARMGHASLRAALIYQHATRDRDEAIARALGELMQPPPVVDLDERREQL